MQSSDIFTIIQDIAKTESTKEKQKKLEAHKDNEELKLAFMYAYKKSLTFGVSDMSIPLPEKGGNKSITEFYEVLEQLIKREVTGNAAKDLVDNTIISLESGTARVARGILRRDLECGIGVGIVNKVWKDLIPKQPQQLAQPSKKENIARIEYPAYAQLKADGARCYVIVRDGIISMVSRSGKEYLGLTNIQKDILKMISNNPHLAQDAVFDGELVYKENGVTNRQLSNGIANKALSDTISDDEQQKMTIELWDFIEADQYFDGLYEVEYQKRLLTLGEYIDSIDSNNVEIIESHIVYSLDDAVDVYQKYIDAGLEGIILKNKNHYWEDKRSKHQVKFKQIIDVDVEIIEVYPHKKEPHKAGGFKVRTADGLVECKAGSGLSDTTRYRDKKTKEWIDIPLDERPELDREYVMAHKDEYIGKILQLQCNGLVTRKGIKDGEAKYRLYLPIVDCMRHDKNVANTIDEVDWEGISWAK